MIRFLGDLLRFDTTNFGGGRSNGEAGAAAYVADRLRDWGHRPRVVARDEAGQRANVIARVNGRDPSLPALLVQQHLDVVPAEPEQWSTDPFGGEIRDGYIFGRGAVDMKDMAAMTLATLADWHRRGVRPRRDLVIAFVADEEANGTWGAEWLADTHPELFAGCEAAIGEEGAQVLPTVDAAGRPVRLYPIACAERGTMHIRLSARGLSGHGSRPTGEDAVHRLLEVTHRLATHRWPLHLSTVVRAELEQTATALGYHIDLSTDAGISDAVQRLGHACGVTAYTTRASTTPTVLHAGYMVNVIPGSATAEVDVRCPPGFTDELESTLARLIGDRVEWEYITRQPPVEAPIDSPWYADMKASVEEFDPGAIVVPHCMGGGTDAKAFARLGMQNYGFSPLGPDPDGRRPGGIHSIDERNTVAGVEIGQRMLQAFLERG